VRTRTVFLLSFALSCVFVSDTPVLGPSLPEQAEPFPPRVIPVDSVQRQPAPLIRLRQRRPKQRLATNRVQPILWADTVETAVPSPTGTGVADTVRLDRLPVQSLPLVFSRSTRDSIELVQPAPFLRSFTIEIESERPGPFERLAWVFGASLAFSAADYIGSNLTEHSQEPHIVFKYKLVQYVTQLALGYLLYKKCGLPSAIAFGVFWWCFGDDMLYYCIAEAVNPGGKFEGRGSLGRVVRDGVYHAGWTPVGLARGGHQRSHIPGDAILGQSLVGFGLAVTITVSF
jgi:hypothetical protein